MRSIIKSPAVISRGRRRTLDVAFPFRMGAGFSGDVNRTHPFNDEPTLVDLTSPPLFYGCGGVIDATTKKFRRVLAGDTAFVSLYGVAVRPYPTSGVPSASFGAPAAFGGGTPPTNQPLSVLRFGYILVPIVGAPGKGDPVFIWCTASTGSHVQGGFEASSSGGNTAALDVELYSFNGAPDSNGIGEIIIGLAAKQG